MDKLCVFCFPYAGIGRHLFGDLESIRNCQFISVDWPGKGAFALEPPCYDMPSLIDSLLMQLSQYRDRPIAMFGHCLGGLVAFELACAWVDYFGIQPSHLFVSGCLSPTQFNVVDPISHLAPADFLTALALRRASIASKQQDVSSILLASIRADFKLYEEYQYTQKKQVHCPINVFYGENEHLDKAGLQAWDEVTTQAVNYHIYPGDHYFIHHAMHEVGQTIEEVCRYA